MCLNLELTLPVLFSVCDATSGQIVLNVHVNNRRVVYTCLSDVDKHVKHLEMCKGVLGFVG